MSYILVLESYFILFQKYQWCNVYISDCVICLFIGLDQWYWSCIRWDVKKRLWSYCQYVFWCWQEGRSVWRKKCQKQWNMFENITTTNVFIDKKNCPIFTVLDMYIYGDYWSNWPILYRLKIWGKCGIWKILDQ